jgi:hypothetical protein
MNANEKTPAVWDGWELEAKNAANAWSAEVCFDADGAKIYCGNAVFFRRNADGVKTYFPRADFERGLTDYVRENIAADDINFFVSYVNKLLRFAAEANLRGFCFRFRL